MLFLLGETAAARELGSNFYAQKIDFLTIDIHNERFILHTPQGQQEGDLTNLIHWISNFACTAVLDVSHPSCSTRLGKLKEHCEHQEIPYLRLERPETVILPSPLIHPVISWEQALDKLGERVLALNEARKKSTNPITVFVTTGSHQLDSLVQSSFASHVRFVVRVLPEGRLVQKCQDLGIAPRNIIAMQGPFSKELNRMLFKFYGADIIFTRDSGRAGGTDTKISAALALGLELVVLKRAAAKQGAIVHSVKEMLAWVKANQRILQN